MYPTTRTALSAIMTMLLLALAVSSASALRSIQSSERSITALSRALSFATELGTVICEVGISLTLNEARIPKRTSNSIARMSYRVLNSGEECPESGGRRARVRFLTEAAPYGVNYISFSGTLPEIESIMISTVGVGFRVDTPLLVECLIRVEWRLVVRIIAMILLAIAGGRAGETFTLENVTKRGAFCPGSLEIRGSFLPVGTAPTFRLV